jgi:hypothetical protein
MASVSGALAAACAQDGQRPGSATGSSGSAPVYSDPLAGLYNMPASAVPNDVSVDYYTPGASRTGRPATRAVLTMAVVPGANYDRLRDYFDAKKSSFLGGSSDDLDAKKTVRRVLEVLKERYPWIELMDDVAMAQQRNVSLTLVVDIRAVLGSPNLAQVDVIVFDEQHKPISRIAVEGRASGSFQDALTQALAQLGTKARTYLT